jgi:hypothetical protein
MTYEEQIQFLFKRFTYKTTQTATTQEWYKMDEPSQLGQMDSWEQDGCIYLLNQGPPKSLTVRNESGSSRNIKDSYILQPGESFTTQDTAWVNKLVNKPSIHQKTTISDAIALAAEELKIADECPHCGKVLMIGDSKTCPHGIAEFGFTGFTGSEFGTMIPAKAGKTVVYGTKQISPVEKPKGRFIKLK